jgi:DNA-binding CsgD family transcriptional regulator
VRADLDDLLTALYVLVDDLLPESRYAMSLVEELPERSGYLLKDRASEIGSLADALRRIGDGECVIDPTIVSRLVSHRRNAGPLAELTAREREVLALMAEGHSNQGICERLFLSPKTLAGHIGNIFRKLDIGDALTTTDASSRCSRSYGRRVSRSWWTRGGPSRDQIRAQRGAHSRFAPASPASR